MHVPWRRSLVAGLNAHFRLRETARPDGVLADPLARHLADDHVVLRLLAGIERWLPAVRRVSEAQAAAHVVRHASVDALVRDAVRDGFRQVVIVGAGYDTRAARIGGARYFEVDQAALAARKAACLAAVDMPVARVALDVTRGPLGPALAAAGWDPAAPTCFVVEGLLHYLDRARVFALLDEMAAGGPRRVVLSWIEPAMSTRVSSAFRELVRLLGEVPRTFFTAAELDARFRAAGLAGLRRWSYAEQVADFAPAAAARPVGLTQEVGVAG